MKTAAFLYINNELAEKKKNRAWVDHPIYNSFKKYLGWGAWRDGSADKGVWDAIPGIHLKSGKRTPATPVFSEPHTGACMVHTSQ